MTGAHELNALLCFSFVQADTQLATHKYETKRERQRRHEAEACEGEHQAAIEFTGSVAQLVTIE